MGLKFNPLTGNFDFTGSGGGGASYIDGEVATYADLPLDGSATLNSAWLVRTASGVWPVTRKQAGIYIRTASGGSSRDDDYTYAGTMPDVFSDSVFLLYDEASTTRTGQFNLGSITAGQNRVLTWPNASGAIALREQLTDLSPDEGGILPLSAYSLWDTANQHSTLRINDNDILYSGAGYSSASLSAQNLTADRSYNLPNASGTIALTSGTTFTNLSAAPTSGSALTLTGGTVTASAPLIDATQTWNASGTTFTGFRLNATNTASATASLLADFQVGGTSVANIRRDGRILANSFALAQSSSIGTGFSFHSATEESGHLQCVNNAGTQMWTCVASRFRLAGDLSFGRSVGLGQSPDTILVRDDVATLAQRNAANAQTFRIYNTFTSTTKFERLNVRWASNELIIDAEAGSGGGTLRGIKIGSASTSLLGFFGATPVVRQAAVADATDAASVITQLNALLSRMRTLGLIAT